MPNPFHAAMPLALLTCFAFAGCGSNTQEEPAAEETTVAESEATPQSAPVADVATTTDATDQAGTDAPSAPKEPPFITKIKEFLQPDVIGPGLDQNIAKIQEELAGITDEASANEALPKLKAISNMIGQISAFKQLVPPESGPIIAEKLQAAGEPLQASIDKLYENEKVAEILKPTLSKVISRFEGVVKQYAVQPEEETADTDETEETADTEGTAETEEPEAAPEE